ncbi:uncharacterized protein LOC124371705, partial [Homalodisca vitripennis]|uniref:uncharacterized protein LOC124371705 n=1 Tax=Homalodisca vitripennis TaxID=197043 RepID=UPI001EEA7804
MEETPATNHDALVNILNSFKAEICSELKEYRKQFDEFKLALEVVSDKLDQSNMKMAQLSENYKDLKKENKELKDSNKVLCEEVNSLKTRVRLAEQYSIKCNVEIQGIPVTTNEDAVSLATDVGAALGVVLSAEDVMAAHRVPTFRPRAAPPLVVQLRDRRMKETIVAAYKKKKELK